MTRSVPTFTLEGLRGRLEKMEVAIRNLQRRGDWRFDREGVTPSRGVFISDEELPDASSVTLSWTNLSTPEGEGIAIASGNVQRISITRAGLYLISEQTVVYADTAQTPSSAYGLVSPSVNVIDPGGASSWLPGAWQQATAVYEPNATFGVATYANLPTNTAAVALASGSAIEVELFSGYNADTWTTSYLDIARIG